MSVSAIRRRFLFPVLLAMFVACGSLTGWIIGDLRNEVRRVHDQSKADSWYLDQAMFELERFLYALSAHVAGIEPVDYQTVLLRYDIFWSRIPVISEGDLAATYRNWLGNDDYVSGWPEALELIDAELKRRSDARGDLALLYQVESIAAPLRARLHAAIIDFSVLHDSQDAEALSGLNRLVPLQALLTASFLLASVSLIFLLFREARLARRAEADALDSRERFRHFAQSASDWLWETDEHLKLTFVSGQVASSVAVSPSSVIGRTLPEIVEHEPGHDGWRSYRVATESRQGFRELALEFRAHDGQSHTVRISGEPVFEPGDNFRGYRGVCTEISKQVDQERRIRHLAEHDQLTGLPNRTLFNSRLEHALTLAHRKQVRTALLLVDLDQFKDVNDSHGHDTGDALLIAVARVLAANLRESDTLARLGGDEFAIILEYFEDDPWECERFAERLVEELQHPIQADGYTLHVGASIGIALFPDDGAGTTELLKAADLALYRAKDLGRGRVQFFLQEMNDRLQRKKLLEAELAKAVAENSLTLYYQPLFRLGSQELIGAEALLRWNHEHLGPIGPAEFVPVAEQCGMIARIGQWVMETACREAAGWPESVRVSVNVSPAQFSSRDLCSGIRHALESSGLSPRRLQLEITETLLIRDTRVAISILEELHEMGISIAIDDFGTGYSSLSYLKRFSIDVVKVDRSFVKDIAETEDDRSIVRGIVTLAQAFGIRTIAEGVENAEQCRLVHSLGCDEVQGFHLGPPVPAADFHRAWISGDTSQRVARESVSGG